MGFSITSIYPSWLLGNVFGYARQWDLGPKINSQPGLILCWTRLNGGAVWALKRLDESELSTPLSNKQMKFNVRKIWRKIKMKKRLKINLPLDVSRWMFRSEWGVFLLVEIEWAFDGVSSGFLVVFYLGKWGFSSNKICMHWTRVSGSFAWSSHEYAAGCLTEIWLVVGWIFLLCSLLFWCAQEVGWFLILLHGN